MVENIKGTLLAIPSVLLPVYRLCSKQGLKDTLRAGKSRTLLTEQY